MSTELPERVEHDSLENYRRKYPGGDKSDHTYPYLLETLAKTIPNRLAFAQGDRRITWKEYDEKVNRLANALLDLGIKKEDRVAIMGFNSIEWWEASDAIFKIGAILATINARQALQETLHVLKDSESVAIILDDEYIDDVNKIRGELPLLKHFIVYRRTGKEIPSDMLDYHELESKYPATKPKLDYKVTNEDICMIYYTGGTTGVPKGTVWDYENQFGNMKKNPTGSFAALGARIGNLPRSVYETLGGMLPIPGLGPIVGRLLDSKGVRRLLSADIVGDLAGALVHSLVTTRMSYMFIGGDWLLRTLCLSQQFHGSGWSTPRVLGTYSMGCCVYFITKAHPFDAREALELIEERRSIC